MWEYLYHDTIKYVLFLLVIIIAILSILTVQSRLYICFLLFKNIIIGVGLYYIYEIIRQIYVWYYGKISIGSILKYFSKDFSLKLTFIDFIADLQRLFNYFKGLDFDFLAMYSWGLYLELCFVIFPIIMIVYERYYGQQDSNIFVKFLKSCFMFIFAPFVLVVLSLMKFKLLAAVILFIVANVLWKYVIVNLEEIIYGILQFAMLIYGIYLFFTDPSFLEREIYRDENGDTYEKQFDGLYEDKYGKKYEKIGDKLHRKY